MTTRTSHQDLKILLWFVPLSCAVTIVLLFLIGSHGDNWSEVQIMGGVFDAESESPLKGVTVCWGSNQSGPGCGEVPNLPKTDSRGFFQVERKLHFAVYLFRSSYYQPIVLDFEKEGYLPARFEFPVVKVDRAKTAGQVIDVGNVFLVPRKLPVRIDLEDLPDP
jgi:hypothetical protein